MEMITIIILVSIHIVMIIVLLKMINWFWQDPAANDAALIISSYMQDEIKKFNLANTDNVLVMYGDERSIKYIETLPDGSKKVNQFNFDKEVDKLIKKHMPSIVMEMNK